MPFPDVLKFDEPWLMFLHWVPGHASACVRVRALVHAPVLASMSTRACACGVGVVLDVCVPVFECLSVCLRDCLLPPACCQPGSLFVPLSVVCLPSLCLRVSVSLCPCVCAYISFLCTYITYIYIYPAGPRTR